MREFASVLGGSVEVRNTPDQGARFQVELMAPASEVLSEAAFLEPPLPLAPQVLLSQPASEATLPRLLLAEDDPELASYMSVVLGGVAQIKWVRDGETALNCLESYEPQLVLSDVMMPGIGGFELCRESKGSRAGPVYRPS